jgi:hypothetical protein
MGGQLLIDTINENTTNNGVVIEGVTLKDNILDAHTIKASNFNVGTKNVISASGQGNFIDLEIKNNNGTKLLIDGDSGNINAKIIDIIEKVINSKSNGEILMTLIRDNSRLAQDILNDETIKIKNIFKLLKFYKNINKIEKIFNFEKNSLLTNYQIKQRFILRLKYYFTKIKEKLLLCKI